MMLNLYLLAWFTFLFNPSIAAALFANAIWAWLHMQNMRAVASYAMRDHVWANGSPYLYIHSVPWSTDMICGDWLLVHTWGHIHLSRMSWLHTTWCDVNLSWMCLLRIHAHRLLLRIHTHWLLGITTHWLLRISTHRLLGIATHWLLLRISTHRLLGIATHWLLRVSTHLLLLRIATHGLILRLAAMNGLLSLDCNISANLSAGNLSISVNKHWLFKIMRDLS